MSWTSGLYRVSAIVAFIGVGCSGGQDGETTNAVTATDSSGARVDTVTVEAAAAVPVADTSDETVASTDSAGVRIVTVRAGARDTVRLTDALVTIGREGATEYEFYQVASVLGLESGVIVVANGATRELRYYTPEGGFIGAVGRQGDGPGEFRFLGRLQRLGADTVLALDGNARRFSTFSPSREFVRTFSYRQMQPFQPPAGIGNGLCQAPSARGMTPRGILLVTRDCLELRGTDGLRNGIVDAVLWDSVAGSARPLPQLVNQQLLLERSGRPLPESYSYLPFAAVPGYALGVDEAWQWSKDDYSLRSYSLDGNLSLIVRDLMPRIPVDEALWATYLSALSERDRSVEQDLPRPDSLPAFFAAFVASDMIWAQHYKLASSTSVEWSVYRRSSGERVTTIAFPPDFRLFDVANGLAYGVARNDVGVERIRAYALPPVLRR